jgi:1-hydroxycarotenoid 3,4-desaturase
MAEAIVVGAGIGGLSAAIELASKGFEVTIVEAAQHPGGKAGTATVDGVRFDTGPSVLTLPEVFDDVFRAAGSSLAQEVELRAPQPSFRYLYPDGTHLDVHLELESTIESVRQSLGGQAADELAAFLDYAGTIWDAAAPAFVFGAAPSFKSVLFQGFAGMRAATRIDPFRSMRSAIARRVRSPHLRMLLWRYATYNGSDVRSAPATLNCIAHVELALGGYGVQGGMQALVEALVRCATRLGVRLQLGTPVREIVLEGGAVAGVRLAGGELLRAGHVIANVDVAHLLGDLLQPEVKHGLDQGYTPSMSGYNAVLRAARRHGRQRRVAHTVLFPDDYEAEFADIFDRDRPPANPTVYLCAQEPCHGVAGWPEHEPLFVMANAPAEPADDERPAQLWLQLEARARQRMLDAELIDPSDQVVWRRSPADLARLFPGSRGAIYGASSNSRSAAFRRAPNRVPRVPGLFIASGSAHPGGGVPMAALSGRAAARAVLDNQLSPIGVAS